MNERIKKDLERFRAEIPKIKALAEKGKNFILDQQKEIEKLAKRDLEEIRKNLLGGK